MAKHSPLGASGAHRWMRCPGSVRLSDELPSRSSIHAATGTVAHKVNEQCLDKHLEPADFLGETVEQDGFNIEITEDMVEACQLYVDTIRLWSKNRTLLLEAPFHLKNIDERLWGTSDAILWDDVTRNLGVIDYKHGAGTYVPVEDNAQLKYYALGALLEHGYQAVEVSMVIIQPRMQGREKIREYTVEAWELLDFAADLQEAVYRVDSSPDVLVPGEHCKFCPAQPICPALRQTAMEMAKQDFAPDIYTPEEISRAMAWLPRLESWIKAVREFAYQELTAGRPVPGYKLVDKRGMRVWSDEKQVEEELGKIGLSKVETHTRKLKSPAQMEKQLGKEAYQRFLAQHAVMHSSGATVAPESDKRPAIDPVANDFPADSSA